MVDQSGLLLPWFLEMVAKQNEINSHTIMPTDLFKSDFTGDPPLKRTRGSATARSCRPAPPRRPMPERPTAIPIR
jgi:hypothetical protein